MHPNLPFTGLFSFYTRRRRRPVLALTKENFTSPHSSHQGLPSAIVLSGLPMISNQARSSKSGALREILRRSGLPFAQIPSDYLANGHGKNPKTSFLRAEERGANRLDGLAQQFSRSSVGSDLLMQ